MRRTPESPARFSNLRSETEGRSAGSDMAQGEVLTPALYARCYALCRSAIRSLPGHRDDQVLVAAVAPWNDQTRYAGNEWGDWAVYRATYWRCLALPVVMDLRFTAIRIRPIRG